MTTRIFVSDWGDVSFTPEGLLGVGRAVVKVWRGKSNKESKPRAGSKYFYVENGPDKRMVIFPVLGGKDWGDELLAMANAPVRIDVSMRTEEDEKIAVLGVAGILAMTDAEFTMMTEDGEGGLSGHLSMIQYLALEGVVGR